LTRAEKEQVGVHEFVVLVCARHNKWPMMLKVLYPVSCSSKEAFLKQLFPFLNQPPTQYVHRRLFTLTAPRRWNQTTRTNQTAADEPNKKREKQKHFNTVTVFFPIDIHKTSERSGEGAQCVESPLAAAPLAHRCDTHTHTQNGLEMLAEILYICVCVWKMAFSVVCVCVCVGRVLRSRTPVGVLRRSVVRESFVVFSFMLRKSSNI